jgi:hypothetical protein
VKGLRWSRAKARRFGGRWGPREVLGARPRHQDQLAEEPEIHRRYSDFYAYTMRITLEPALNFQWFMTEAARSAIRHDSETR